MKSKCSIFFIRISFAAADVDGMVCVVVVIADEEEYRLLLPTVIVGYADVVYYAFFDVTIFS